ncbi:hypothetical protein POSPLADRAFT_1057515 [Postia placenta MAD-698-R-SB12]|uniref:Fucose-specific lectin n=1 Tax=Postia placenta MAD-698-R-SB12 TaxID=670580 RepID=A0A1X6MZU9_9APHY|nr:hypothetical protein POSPLADRAFT_1057515 [Postia placenta MAD-698-R-SB12]OSX61746.1 hypothetical protein POSPLADRAFT_1057515 [Postia placenta MAD-698-R-SB12]
MSSQRPIPPHVAGFINPRSSGDQVYIFKDDRYILIQVDPSLTDTLLSGPHCIADDWVSLEQVGFSCIDAALPNPSAPNQVFFFFQDRYVLVEVCSTPGARDDKLIDGPKNTLIEFANLQGPQFGTPDVTLQVAWPADDGYYWVYFFKDTNWLQFSFKPGADGHGVSIRSDGSAKDIDAYWQSLKKVGFNTVDMAFPRPGGDGHEVYFFSGTQYAKIWYKAGESPTCSANATH